MAETFIWKLQDKETFIWKLPVIESEVPQTNVFVDSDGVTQFIDSETKQPFRDNGL